MINYKRTKPNKNQFRRKQKHRTTRKYIEKQLKQTKKTKYYQKLTTENKKPQTTTKNKDK